MPEERLQKLIAAAGLASRRQAETLLRAGRVSVNGQVAQLGDRADPERDAICLDGRPLRPAAPPLVLLLNKPAGVVCSCNDPEGRPIVLDLLPPELARGQGLHPVGRLDVNSRGALLLRNNGALTLQLTHPRFQHSKTYRVWVRGRPSRAVLDRWARGVPLDGRPSQPVTLHGLEQQARVVLERTVGRQDGNDFVAARFECAQNDARARITCLASGEIQNFHGSPDGEIDQKGILAFSSSAWLLLRCSGSTR
jgi:pseudouridine synthase